MGGGVVTLIYERGGITKVINVDECGIPEHYISYDEDTPVIDELYFEGKKQGLEKIKEGMEVLRVINDINNVILLEMSEKEGELEVPDEILRFTLEEQASL